MTEQAAPIETPAPKAPDSSLKTRVKSALIMAAIVLVILGFGGGSFTFLFAAIAGIGAFEWVRMIVKGGTYPKILAELSGGVTALATLAAGVSANPVISLWLLLALSFMVFAYNYANNGGQIRRVILGVLYVGFGCAIMIWLRNGAIDNRHGLFNIVTLLFIVWASDSCAYFTGRTFGGPKLAPSVSPKKTWSGFIGGSAGAGLVAALLAMAAPYMGVTPLGGTGPVFYFILGFVLSMVGQAGDLMISTIKRFYEVKDTGALIPGHGGILDRIDALLLVAFVFGSIAKILGA